MVDSPHGQNTREENGSLFSGKPSQYLGMVRVVSQYGLQSDNSPREWQKHHRKSPEQIVADYTKQLSFWTAALVLVAVVSGFISFFTLQTINGQLNEMQMDERPWIQGSVLNQNSKVVFSEGDILYSNEYTFRNFGKTAALKTIIRNKIVPFFIGEDKTDHISAFRDDVCNQMVDLKGENGLVVFPGETTEPITVEERQPIATQDRNKPVYMVQIFVCIRYTFADGLGYSSFMFSMFPKKSNVFAPWQLNHGVNTELEISPLLGVDVR